VLILKLKEGGFFISLRLNIHVTSCKWLRLEVAFTTGVVDMFSRSFRSGYEFPK
jgi:hypothetical protein